MDEKTRKMTTAPVEGLLLRLALPSITIMMISSMYNMADTFFVGSLGTSATAAVGVVFPLMAVIQAVGFFFGHGSGNYISRQLGAGHNENASRMAATGVVSALVMGAVIAVLGLILQKPLAQVLGATETILPHAESYMRFILVGAPWMATSLTLNNLLRYQGSAAYGMIGMVAGAVLNVGLDPLFIFVFGMGVGGAALATMLSQAVSFVLLLVGSSKGGNISIKPRLFSPSLAIYREMVRGGLSSLLRQGLASVAIIVQNQVAGLYGDAAIAAISIVQRVTNMAFSAMVGFGQGFQPVCGFNYGARLYSRMKRAFAFCVKIGFGVLLVLAVAGFIFAPQVIALFRRDDALVIEIGTLALRAACLVLPLQALSTLSNMMLQTIGFAGRASLLAVARQGMFLLPFLLILSSTLGLLGVQLAQPVADVATFALAAPIVLQVLKKMPADGQ